MVGLVTAKGLALAAGKPLIAVNHLEGHALSPMLSDPDLAFPYLLLLVSGGHCQLLLVEGVGRYRRLATTIDDAAGEAFDKTAKLLGLGFPGGPAVERGGGRRAIPRAVPLPRPLVGSDEPHFSFAGLKSAVLRAKRERPLRATRTSPPPSSRRWSIAWSTARARALERGRRRDRAGRRRRRRRQSGGPRRAHRARRRRTACPSSRRRLWLCTDNAAMIAWAGALRFEAGLIDGARRAGAGALAARSGRREGARRGGEGMRIGVIGARRLGHGAGPGRGGGRRGGPALGARARGGRGGQRAPRERALPQGRAARPTIRATGDLADLADCDALLVVTPAQHLRAVLGGLTARRQAAGPLRQGDRGRRPAC